MSQGIEILQNWNIEEAENAEWEINYRCVNCINCNKCFQGNHIQSSIKEEVVQNIIDQSITIDVRTGKTEEAQQEEQMKEDDTKKRISELERC